MSVRRLKRMEGDPGFPKEPHAFIVNTLSADPFVRGVALSGQDSIGALQSGGTMPPTPASVFELPIVGPLPETLNYIP